MTTTLTNLTSALADAIAQADGLAAVHLTAAAGPFDTAPLPAATLSLARLDRGSADDFLDGLWRVEFELAIWRRDGQPQANAAALQALADDAIDALLEDPTQGGLASPGSGGSPTEILRVSPGPQQGPPLGSILIRFACRVLPADGLTPLPEPERVQIDGSSPLASGPHRLVIHGEHRRRIDRAFAGLNGTVSIDLGSSGRTMTLAGRLVGISRADLLVQVADVESFNDGLGHTLAAPDGRTFAGVRFDEIRWGRVLSPDADGVSAIGYQIDLSRGGA